MKFYVYYGYVNSDNYDNHPTHKLTQFATAKQAADFCTEIKNDLPSDAQFVDLRIIEGTEVSLKPVETVVKYIIDK